MAGVGAGHVDLTDRVATKDVFVLNIAPGTSQENLFIPDPRLVIRSDADAQLIVHVPFTEPVKLYSLILEAPAGEEPTVIKVHINRPSFGFEEVDDEPTQLLDLTPANYGKDVQTKLRYVKFQFVTHVDLVLERPGAASVALGTLRFTGTPIAGADVSKIRKAGMEMGGLGGE